MPGHLPIIATMVTIIGCFLLLCGHYHRYYLPIVHRRYLLISIHKITDDTMRRREEQSLNRIKNDSATSQIQILKPHYFVLWTNCLRLSILDRDQKDKIMRQKYYDKQKSYIHYLV